MKTLADGSLLIMNRQLSAEQIDEIRTIIAKHPQLKRSALALQVCALPMVQCHSSSQTYVNDNSDGKLSSSQFLSSELMHMGVNEYLL